MKKDSRILVLGGRGMVGSAIWRKLVSLGYQNIYSPTSIQFDLRDDDMVHDLFHRQMPEYVFLAAAKVGGIIANSTLPVEFLDYNLRIQNNVIEYCYLNNVKRLIFTGSSCIYPRECPQPIKEEYLLTGPLEPTNKPYALAKIAGIELCKAYNKQYGTDFISVMPCNLYGPGDNYHPEHSHVIPGLLRKFHEGVKLKKDEVTVWGSGRPLREFMHVDDLAACMVKLMEYNGKLPDLINIGSGEEIDIKFLIDIIVEYTKFEGMVRFDKTKPDGTMRKLLDCTLLHSIPNFKWQPEIKLLNGLKQVYAEVKHNL